MRVYQNRAKFAAGQKFSTWLYAIASNQVKDRYRWRSRHPQMSLDAENEQTGVWASRLNHRMDSTMNPAWHRHARHPPLGVLTKRCRSPSS